MGKVEEYTAKGFDTRTAEYFAAGRRNIVAVSAEENFALRLTFDDGEVRLLDCKPFLQPDTVFAPFMKQENFRRVYLDDCNCVAWDIDPNVDSDVVWSNKVDLCSDTCYLDSVPMGVNADMMTSEEIQAKLARGIADAETGRYQSVEKVWEDFGKSL